MSINDLALGRLLGLAVGKALGLENVTEVELAGKLDEVGTIKVTVMVTHDQLAAIGHELSEMTAAEIDRRVRAGYRAPKELPVIPQPKTDAEWSAHNRKKPVGPPNETFSPSRRPPPPIPPKP